MAGDQTIPITFQCVHCGSPIPVHALGQSMTFVCPSCKSIVQEDNDGYKVLVNANQSVSFISLLELGKKFTFGGQRWQAIGFMVRFNDAERFHWSEYLLFNPYEGYRFLVESDGHWTFMELTRRIPKNMRLSGRPRVSWMGRTYTQFYTGKARVGFVLGEFYWRVKVGDTIDVQDFIAPPAMLSLETSLDEVMWTSGVYVDKAEIQKCFGIQTMPRQSRIGSNQPSSYKLLPKLVKSWAFLALILTLIQCCFVVISTNTRLFNKAISFPNGKGVFKTDSFEMPNANSNLQLDLSASVVDSWVDIIGTVVPEHNQEAAFAFQRELSLYSDGEGGYEGDRQASLFFPQMKKGPYHIEFDLEKENKGGSPNSLTVSGILNPPTQLPFWICLSLLSLFPLLYWLAAILEEKNRWLSSNVEVVT
ncbi:MAG: DUF4178 domain-containing protein [Chitinophagaceae bacterium]|nr:DUF4178 domain-containing protein [Oligoflexus sp.]